MLNVLKSHTSKSRRKSMSPNQSPVISPTQSPNDSTATSPFHSPQPSTTASPNISPTNSPMMLRRASVYKNKSKKQITHRGTMDEIIRKKREVKRTRSKSTPSIPGVFNLTKRNSLNVIKTDSLNVKTRDSLTVSKRDSFNVKKRDSISGVSSYSEESVSDGKEYISSTESINTQHTETKKRQFKKSPNQRKKSFGAIIGASLSHIDLKTDFKRIMDSKTKLRRSSSHRAPQIKTKEVVKVSQTSFSDDDNENYKGPLFQATTMFVPGYDFNTKTATPVLNRKPSTPLFGRRGSKERLTLPPLFNRNAKDRLSVPNLVRRGSKDKVKKLENRFSDHYGRSDSSPPEITLNLNSSYENNSSEEEDFLTVAERQMQLNSKHKRFENMGKLNERRTMPLEVPIEGKVKKISGQFESGSVYSKRAADQAEKDGFRKKLSSIDRSIFRQRAESFENGALFKKNKCIDYQPSPPKYSTEERNNRYSCGEESGYASPNEINEDTYTNNQMLNTNKCLRNLYLDNLNKKKTRVESLQECTIVEDEFSNSWSHGQWKREDKTYHLVRQPHTTREFSTDLCVTEL